MSAVDWVASLVDWKVVGKVAMLASWMADYWVELMAEKKEYWVVMRAGSMAAVWVDSLVDHLG